MKMECLPVDDQARNVRSRHAPPNKDWHVQAAIIDEAELGQLARLVARLAPDQRRFMVALADGFRGGRPEPFQRERAWRGSDLIDEGVPGDDRTWLARRPGGASTEETTPADHPAVLALLSPGSLTASRSLRRHLARKV
jgi:hypothetical protein